MGASSSWGLTPNIAADDHTNLLTEHEITWDRHHRTLARGSTTDENSPFAYRMARSAAAVLDLATQQPVQDREDPTDLLDALARTARLQTVKCMPRRERSSRQKR
jgi:hypothetical protein